MEAHEAPNHWGLAEQAAGFGVWDLDVAAQQVLYSPQWKALLGYPAVDGVDAVATWRARVHPEDLDDMVAALAGHIEGRSERYEHQFRLRAADGSDRRVLSCGQAVVRDADGKALRVVGTLTDLTRRQSASVAAAVPQAEPQAHRFWQQVSHDFRTPLNAVLGFSQLLSSRLGVEDLSTQQLYLAHIEKAGWQLLRLLESAMGEQVALRPPGRRGGGE